MRERTVSQVYLPPDARERLLRYEYRGEDRSYIYKYMWRPLCRRVVEMLPPWLAPNVITVAALALVCLTHALLLYYMPKLTVKKVHYLQRNETGSRVAPIPFAKEFLPPPPGYVFVLAALGLFLYQLLDNLDGHQARRTGTSSPLGLLMDHGCDAFNCIVGSLSVASAVSAGPCWKAWLIVLNTLVVFFMNTWEEYYRGVLVLPVINGPNEGILLAISIYLWTAWVGGPHWWYDKTVSIPTRWLPEVLRQPAPQAAVAVERIILDRVCPVFDRVAGHRHIAGRVDFRAMPFLFNLNCSAAYRSNPPTPVEVHFAVDPTTADREQTVLGKLYDGHSVVQTAVLRAYGTRDSSLRVRYNTVAVLIMTALAITTCLGNVYQTWLAIRRRTSEDLSHAPGSSAATDERHPPGDATARRTKDRRHQFRLDFLRRRFPFLHACTKLLPLAVVTAMANVWFYTSQENIFRRHPRVFSWTVGLLYTKLAIHVMVSHLCGTEFHPLRRTLVPFLLFGAHITMTWLHNLNKLRRALGGRYDAASGMLAGELTVSAQDTISNMALATSSAVSAYAYDLDEELILYEFFALSVVTFAHLVWHVVRETADVLNVPIFTVPAEKQRALREQLSVADAPTAKAVEKKTKTTKGKQKEDGVGAGRA